jgi:hypothetical protein
MGMGEPSARVRESRRRGWARESGDGHGDELMRKTTMVAGRRPYPLEGGHNCPYESTEPPIRLQVGLRRRRAYKMACFKELNNCNGTRTVSRIVMAFFKNAEIIMAQI